MYMNIATFYKLLIHLLQNPNFWLRNRCRYWRYSLLLLLFFFCTCKYIFFSSLWLTTAEEKIQYYCNGKAYFEICLFLYLLVVINFHLVKNKREGGEFVIYFKLYYAKTYSYMPSLFYFSFIFLVLCLSKENLNHNYFRKKQNK